MRKSKQMDAGREHIRFEFGFATDAGRKRSGEPNQDALDVVLPHPRDNWHPPLLVIADGLGKHMGGAMASQLVVQTFKREFVNTNHPAEYLSVLERCAQKAHEAVRSEGAKDARLAHMGSTVVAATLYRGTLYLLNVGDSRAYILRGKKMIQVSQDQSWAAMQVRAGMLTEQEARSHPSRNRLNMAITARRPEIKPYTTVEKLGLDDIVVLCSDGLWGIVPETLIWAAANELPPDVAVKKLISLANRSRGPDNISVIIARPTRLNQRAVGVNLEGTIP